MDPSKSRLQTTRGLVVTAAAEDPEPTERSSVVTRRCCSGFSLIDVVVIVVCLRLTTCGARRSRIFTRILSS